MKPIPTAGALYVALLLAAPLRAILGVADTSFVTVIANPAEAANWAAELSRLSAQVEAAQSTLRTVSQLRDFAGDPAAAVAALGDLSTVQAAALGLAHQEATFADLEQSWQALGPSGQRALVAAALASSGAGTSYPAGGVTQPRDSARYVDLAARIAETDAARSQIASEQSARAAITGELARAWQSYRQAQSESSKQALLSQISELAAEDQALDSRRKALLDDLALADRGKEANAAILARASDETSLAASASSSALAVRRIQDGEAARAATLAKPAPSAPARDYAQLKLWGPADAQGSP